MSKEIEYEWWLETENGHRVTTKRIAGGFYEEDAVEAGQDMDDFVSDALHSIARQTYLVKHRKKRTDT